MNTNILKKIIQEELQYFMNEIKQRKLYRDDSGKWMIDAEIGNYPIQEFGFKLYKEDYIYAYFLTSVDKTIRDYNIYFPSEKSAWNKRNEFAKDIRNNVTVGYRLIDLNQVVANNRGRKVSLISANKRQLNNGKILKIFEIPKELDETKKYEYEEISANEMLKKMKNDNIMAYAFGAYSFVIKSNEEISFFEWASRIKQTYDINNPANLIVYKTIKSFGKSCRILKNADDELIIKSRK